MIKPRDERRNAGGLVEIIRDVIEQVNADRDTTAICEVESVNGDGTLNLYILPDKKNVISNVINQCRFDFVSGDNALLYLIKNRPSNSFVIAKCNAKMQDTPLVKSGVESNVAKLIKSNNTLINAVINNNKAIADIESNSGGGEGSTIWYSNASGVDETTETIYTSTITIPVEKTIDNIKVGDFISTTAMMFVITELHTNVAPNPYVSVRALGGGEGSTIWYSTQTGVDISTTQLLISNIRFIGAATSADIRVGDLVIASGIMFVITGIEVSTLTVSPYGNIASNAQSNNVWYSSESGVDSSTTSLYTTYIDFSSGDYTIDDVKTGDFILATGIMFVITSTVNKPSGYVSVSALDNIVEDSLIATLQYLFYYLQSSGIEYIEGIPATLRFNIGGNVIEVPLTRVSE